MHIIRKSVFDIKNVASGNWGSQKMLKVEIRWSKIVESGNWGGGGGADTPPPP